MYIPDNYDLWEAHDRRQAQELKKLPECAYCENPIQDEAAYYINGDWYCERCLEEHFKRAVLPE